MWKKILFLGLLSLATSLACTQRLGAKTWPPGSKIPADEIIAAIKRGENVTIDSSEIFSLLVFRGLEREERKIRSLIIIRNSHFRDPVDFRRCTFLYSCIFFRCTFHEEVRFVSVTFFSGVGFLGCSFKRFACFWDSEFHFPTAFTSTFQGETVFRSAVFTDDVSFAGSGFANKADFDSVVFQGGANFDHLSFEKEADFQQVMFEGESHFSESTFEREADFESATFGETVLFEGTVFGGRADFRKTAFGSESSFEGAQFRLFSNFAGARFEGYGYFHGTSFAGGLNFSLSEFKNFHITWQQIEGRIHGELWWSMFLDSTRTSLKFLRLEGEEIFDPEWARFSTYSRLIKYWEDNRQLDDADAAYLWLKDLERRGREWQIRYPEYWFMQQTCGYGVKPERVLLVSTLIVLAFSFCYWRRGALTEIQERLRHSRRRRIFRRIHRTLRKRFYDALYFSFQTFIIGVVPDWHPTDNYLIHTRRVKLFKFRTLAMIEGALGWTLLVLFVVTLTRKFIR